MPGDHVSNEIILDTLGITSKQNMWVVNIPRFLSEMIFQYNILYEYSLILACAVYCGCAITVLP